MPRSHPPSLIRIVERAWIDEIRLPAQSRVLLALSGGADSMALLSVLARLSSQHRFTLTAHGVDHGLRQEAGPELDRAEDFARTLGIPFTRSRLELRSGSNLQARARDARYHALRKEALRIEAQCIATAHHAEDRAETVLLRLLRGTSPAGLAVLPPRSDDLIRPLIRARKRDVLAHVTRHNVPFSEDPSNRDSRFMRVRVRYELLPLLESLSPRIVEHLTVLADEMVSTRDTSRDTVELGHSATDTGELLFLGAAQRAEIRKMIERHSVSTRVRLRGGKELRLDAHSGALVLEPCSKRGRRN